MKRNIAPEDCLLKLMGDTGGNFFKYCMQIIDMRKVLKEKRARACLSDGLFSHEYNENGVNKIIILAIVAKEGVSECYDLVSKVLKLFNLKVVNCLWNGKMEFGLGLYSEQAGEAVHYYSDATQQLTRGQNPIPSMVSNCWRL